MKRVICLYTEPFVEDKHYVSVVLYRSTQSERVPLKRWKVFTEMNPQKEATVKLTEFVKTLIQQMVNTYPISL